MLKPEGRFMVVPPKEEPTYPLHDFRIVQKETDEEGEELADGPMPEPPEERAIAMCGSKLKNGLHAPELDLPGLLHLQP